MPTLDQVAQALKAADAAGNHEDAAKLARAYVQIRDQPAQTADFSDVTAQTRSTEQVAPSANDSDFARMISGQPKAKPEWRRGLEMGTRSVLQGAGGLVGTFGGDVFNHYVTNPIARAVGAPDQQVLPYREEAARLADRIGLERPRNASERVIGDVNEALTGTALTMGAGSGLNMLANTGRAGSMARAAGNFLTAQPRLQAVSTAAGAGASSATRESGGSEGAQLAAGLLGGLAPAAPAAGAATLRGAIRGRSGENMLATIADFDALGAAPSVGQASGRGWVQGVEGLLSKGPTSSGVMGRFAAQQADDIGRGLQGKAESLSPGASSGSAGEAIERGMQSFKGDTKAVKRALYWAVDQQIPGQTPVPMSNTVRTVTRLATPNPAAPATTAAMIQPRIAQLRQNLATDLQAGGGNLPYEALKRIRSDIGAAIDGSSPLNPSSDLRELQQLYGALSDDMLEAAKAQGPRAVMLAQRANKYTRDVANRMEAVQRVIDKNGGPEKVFQAAMSGTNDGATTLRKVMYSLPQDDQKTVSAAVIKRMGLATPGNQDNLGEVFSAGTFLTNWNKLSDEAKQVLFGRYGSSFKASMDQVARVANNIKQGAKVFANPSGTAAPVAALGYASTLGASILNAFQTGSLAPVGLTVGSGLGANWMARIFTNPAFVNWLAFATTAPIGSATGTLNGLRSMAERNKDPDLMDAYSALSQNYVGNQPNDRANQK